jgi:hypothetical protein
MASVFNKTQDTGHAKISRVSDKLRLLLLCMLESLISIGCYRCVSAYQKDDVVAPLHHGEGVSQQGTAGVPANSLWTRYAEMTIQEAYGRVNFSHGSSLDYSRFFW